MSDARLIGYADPPYPGQSKRHYGGHQDYAGEVCHAELVDRLETEFDGWVLHTSTPAIPQIAALVGDIEGVRWCAWVKPFAAFKKNVPVAYAWEPVIVKAARKPEVGGAVSPLRDWFSEPITMKRGLSGAKPEKVCHWIFECVGAKPGDKLADLFPGTGSVTDAWHTWSAVRESEQPFTLTIPPLQESGDE